MPDSGYLPVPLWDTLPELWHCFVLVKELLF
jgi:hypothetical protein